MFKSRRLFPFLLFSFIVVSAVFSFFLSHFSQKRVNLKQKAVEEQQQLPISEWAPIDLALFNQEIDKETIKINEELNQLPTLKLSTKEKTKKQNLLNRSLQIKQITKEEHNLMDENKDGKISYEEFNKRNVVLANKVYRLRHQTIPSLDNGLYDTNRRKIDINFSNPSTAKNTFKIFVEAGLYDNIRESLARYIADVRDDWRYEVETLLCNNCRKEEIRDILRLPNTIGTLFVGDLPTAWYSDPLFGAFPIDLYFYDTEAIWLEGNYCRGQTPDGTCFIGYNNSENRGTSPAVTIFFGRLAAPVEAEEVNLINHYFLKNHLYRTGERVLPHRALGYQGGDWFTAGGWLKETVFKNGLKDLPLVYPVKDYRSSFVDSNPYMINSQDYLSRLEMEYEFLFVWAHGTNYEESFYANNSRESKVYWYDVKERKPKVNFYYLNSCGNGNYTLENYIAGWYIFQESNYGLAAISAANLSSYNVPDSAFFRALADSNHLGLAFKKFPEQLTRNLVLPERFYGVTFLGDPTLKVRLPNEANPSPIVCQPPIRPIVFSGFPNSNALINFGDPTLRIQDNSLTESCFAHYVVYSIWPTDENATAYLRSSKFMMDNPLTSFARVALPWTVSPPLPAGQYQWRANLKNSVGQALTKEEVLKVNFSVCIQPAVPQLDMLVYGEKRYQGEPVILHRDENLTLRIKDVSDRSTSCFPHDVIFNIWPAGANMYVKSSNWISRIDEPNGTKEWTFRANDLADLPYGEYELRANLDNKSVDKQGNQRTMDSRAPQPLIIPFTYSPMITPTPTPTTEPEPTPTPWHSVCSKTADRVHVYCKQVAGEGENKCSTDLDCETDCGEIYGACKSNTCSPGRECRRGEDNYCACYQE